MIFMHDHSQAIVEGEFLTGDFGDGRMRHEAGLHRSGDAPKDQRRRTDGDQGQDDWFRLRAQFFHMPVTGFQRAVWKDDER